MINRLYHAGTAAVVQFSCNPLRGCGESAHRFQSSGFDSDGAPYVYSKNRTQHRQCPQVYPHQSAAVLAAFVTFLQSRNGDKTPFTWDDHNAVAHTVRFTTGSVKYNETSPGKYRIEFQVSEDL